MRRQVATATLGVLLIALLAACGGKQADTAQKAAGGSALRVGLVFDIGGRGDKSFNDAAFAGLERAKTELGVSTNYVEPGESMDREASLRQLAKSGDDVVFGIGFMFTDDITSIAREFPRQKFACIDYSIQPGKALPANLAALTFKEHEGSFLVGALAALVSKSHIVGFIGGMDSPLIQKFETGFRAGVRTADPKCTVLVNYAGVTGDAFKNPTKGKELALAQFAKGADVIYHASGSTGLGVFEAAKEKNFLAIGVDSDQYGEMPGHILTSMVKGVSTAVFTVAQQAKAGAFVGGHHELGLKERGVDYVYDDANRALISDPVHAKVETYRAMIIGGSLKVPATRADLEAFHPPAAW